MLRGTVLAVALVGCRGPAAGGAVVHAPGVATATPVVVETQPAAPATAPVEAAPVEVPPVEPAAPVPPVVPAAPAQPVAVTVSFVLAPEVGPGPPTLAITVRNPSTQAVPLTRFADPACLVRHYLDLRVVRPNGRDQALAGCAVKDWPGTDESLAAGGEQRYVVPFAELSASWPREAQPATLAALDGPLRDPGAHEPAPSRELLRDTIDTWLKSHPRRLWPEASLASSRELNWELLHDTGGRTGEHRLAAQHTWMLTSPSDRHTLTPPGAARHRLRPDDSGLDNLVLAGDWLTGGLDLGVAESAVIAGLQASRALCGHPRQIPGERDGVDLDQAPADASQSLRVAVA